MTLSGKQETLNRPSKLAWSAGRTGAYGRRVPMSRAACVVTAVALCVCVFVSSLVFSPCGKKERSDSENCCLSVVSMIRSSK